MIVLKMIVLDNNKDRKSVNFQKMEMEKGKLVILECFSVVLFDPVGHGPTKCYKIHGVYKTVYTY